MRFLTRTLLWCLLLVAVTLPGWVWLQSRDLPQVDDRDLAIRHYEVPPAHDGVLVLGRAVALIDLAEEESRFTALHSRSEYWDAQAVRLLLERNTEALDLLDGALTATYFKAPPAPDTPSPEMIGWQRLAKLLVLRAALLASEGDPWTAAADWQRVLTLGARVEQALEGSLLTAKIGLSLRELALDSIHAHAAAGLIPPDMGLELADILPSFRSDPETWSNLWRAEYETLRERLDASPEEVAVAFQSSLEDDSLLRRLLPRDYAYHPQRTRGEFARYFRARVRQTSLPCSAQTRPRFSEVDLDDSWAQRELQLGPNGVGSLLLQVGVEHFAVYGEARCAADALLEATRTVLALRAYESTHGNLPDTLEALGSEFLPGGATDPFDGRRLRYSKAERHVRSVGNDFIDAGGSPGAVWVLQEPTLSVPSPAGAERGRIP